MFSQKHQHKSKSAMPLVAYAQAAENAQEILDQALALCDQLSYAIRVAQVTAPVVAATRRAYGQSCPPMERLLSETDIDALREKLANSHEAIRSLAEYSGLYGFPLRLVFGQQPEQDRLVIPQGKAAPETTI